MHANKVDRAVDGIGRSMTERGTKEHLELRLGHLAAGHREVLVLNRAESGHIARDRNVPRRIGEDRLRPLVAEKPDVALRGQSVATEQAMIAKRPKIAGRSDRRLSLIQRR
jgi:hypothetical protein